MNVKKIAGKAVATVKRNPELALILIGLLAPKLAVKAGRVVTALQTPDGR